jgi:hypothetical protein
MADDTPLVRARCLRDTTDSRYEYFVRGKEYIVKMNHPCMEHFEKLEEVKQKDADDLFGGRSDVPGSAARPVRRRT